VKHRRNLNIGDPGRLAADQRVVFDRLRAIVTAPDADNRYNAVPESRRGRVVSVDVARLLSPEFQTWDAKIRHTPSTATPAGAYAHDRLLRALAVPGPKGRRLVVTAGGAGSGKTSLLNLHKQAVEADLIFDNQLRDLHRAREIIKTAIENAWQAEFVYVHRPFEDAVRAVIERGQRTGRWNRLVDLPQTHRDAQRTIISLRKQHYETPGIKFRAQYNASDGIPGPKRGSRVWFRDMKSDGPYHLPDGQTLLHQIPAILQDAINDGTVCEELASLIAQGLPRGPKG
jgi:hypothetical protein